MPTCLYEIKYIIPTCLFVKRPYNGKSRKEIRDAMLARQVQVKTYDIISMPTGWSKDSVDFTNKV